MRNAKIVNRTSHPSGFPPDHRCTDASLSPRNTHCVLSPEPVEISPFYVVLKVFSGNIDSNHFSVFTSTIKMGSLTPSADAEARASVKQLLSLIHKQGQGDYIGEAVSQAQHSLQAATLARNAGADDETVLGALLHDVGRFIPAAEKMNSMIAADGTYIGKASHEILGERYLRHLGFSEKICQVVGAHVMAKRYLCAAEQGYWENLSRSSKQTLEFQVSPRSFRNCLN